MCRPRGPGSEWSHRGRRGPLKSERGQKARANSAPCWGLRWGVPYVAYRFEEMQCCLESKFTDPSHFEPNLNVSKKSIVDPSGHV